MGSMASKGTKIFGKKKMEPIDFEGKRVYRCKEISNVAT